MAFVDEAVRCLGVRLFCGELALFGKSKEPTDVDFKRFAKPSVNLPLVFESRRTRR